MQIHNAIITGSFSYNGADLSNVTSSNAYSASLSSRTTDLESTSSVLVGASSSFSSILSSVSSSQQQLSSSFLTLTASFNAVSASQQQISASYIALSASYNTFSGSASTRITVDSASLLQVSASQQQISASLLNVISIFATTGSNSFRETQSITGSLTVTGQIIAQTLNVQQVTSSIIYSSGSNNFGCDLNSRQTFTGSLNVTGSSHNIFGNLGIGTTTTSGFLQIGGSDSNGTLYVTASANQNAARLRNNNSSYATLDICNANSTGYGLYADANKHYIAGNLGIGTSNPSKKLHISGSGNNAGITFDVDSGTTLIIRGNTTTNFDLNNEGSGGCIRLYGSAIQFRTNVADPAVVINNGGCVGINCTTPSGRLTIGGDNNQIHVRGGYYASIYGYSGDTNVYGLYSSCVATYLNARSGDGLYLGGSISAPAGGNHLFIDSNGISCFFNTVCAKSGVKFGSGSCCLNYYEEGKWCIYACGSTSGAGPVGEGSYTRVGRLVTASILINSQTFPSYSGGLRLSMPFTAGTGSGLGGNMSWNAGGVYFYPFSAWCSGANFTGIDAIVFNSTNYAQLSIANVNGDRQGAVGSTTTSTSGAGGLYLRFTITYEVSQ